MADPNRTTPKSPPTPETLKMIAIFKPALTLIALASVQAATIPNAAAQPADERARYVQMAAHSQLGILEYCHTLGLVDDTAVAAQKRAIERLPKPPGSNDAGHLEQEAGRAGLLAFGTIQVRFDESSQAQGFTLKTACEGRAALAISVR